MSNIFSNGLKIRGHADTPERHADLDQLVVSSYQSIETSVAAGQKDGPTTGGPDRPVNRMWNSQAIATCFTTTTTVDSN